MTQLQVIYTLVFLAVFFLGIEIGYWLSSRKHAKLNDAIHGNLLTANARSNADKDHWNLLLEKLEALPAPGVTDLTGLEQQSTKIGEQISELARQVGGLPSGEVNLTALEQQSTIIQKQVSDLHRRIGGLLKVQPPGLVAISDQLARMESALSEFQPDNSIEPEARAEAKAEVDHDHDDFVDPRGKTDSYPILVPK